ncbi:MAG: hypothetical protein PHR14_07495 [Oscillospiraceae bacterium]|nr:hypothetical protein [Oscillospiraceae bacterium]
MRNSDGCIPLAEYTQAARNYYVSGRVGSPKEAAAKLEFSKYITGEVARESLYNAGITDAAAKAGIYDFADGTTELEMKKPVESKRKIKTGPISIIG